MRVIAINGSPRKHFNTATLLQKALEGAAACGAETQLHHLGDLAYSPCKSCLACKRKALPQTGRCVLKDDLGPVIEDVLQADAVLFGSPIYFYTESALFRAFLERLLFPLTRYSPTDRSLYKGVKHTALIYTMNITTEELAGRKPPFPQPFALDIVPKTQFFMQRIFQHCEVLLSTDTRQVKTYADYHMEIYDAAAKEQRHAEVFPLDCDAAFALGQTLCRACAAKPEGNEPC